MIEAIEAYERIAGRTLDWRYEDRSRVSDHAWWISDMTAFELDYPEWSLTRDFESILHEIRDVGLERWRPDAPPGRPVQA